MGGGRDNFKVMQVSPFAYSMKRDRMVVWGYTVLWMLYSIQGLFPFLFKHFFVLLTFFLIAVSMGYALYCHRPYVWRVHEETLPVVLLFLDLLLLLITIYNLFYIFDPHTSLLIKSDEDDFTPLKRLYGTMLPLYFYYYYAHKGVIDEAMLRRFFHLFFIFILVKIYANYLCQFELIKSGMTQDAGYDVVILFPMILSFRKNRFLVIPFLLFFLCFSLTIFSMKRGAILIASISFFIFFLMMIKENASKRLKIISFMLALFILMSMITIVFYEESGFFQIRVEKTLEGNLSKRDEIWGILIRHFVENMDDTQSLFGVGANTTYSITRLELAHNDWLQMIVEYGMIGMLLYALFFFSFIKKCFDMRKVSPYAFSLSMMLLVNMVVRMCTHRFIFDLESSPFAYMMLMGFLLSIEMPSLSPSTSKGIR